MSNVFKCIQYYLKIDDSLHTHDGSFDEYSSDK